MPRIARQIATSGIYHIMLRGINRQDIFTDDTDRQRFLQLSHTPTIAQFQQLSLAQPTHYILQASHQGAAMKKLSRITGISYRQINKIVKQKSNNS